MTPDDRAAGTDPPENPIDPGSDEALSAYLAGELDEPGEAAFEARLAAEAMVAAQLDALADALMSLAEAHPPGGFAERLAERLEAEAAVGDLAARRRHTAQRWSGIAMAAAAVAVLAIAGGRLLGPADDDSSQELALKDEAAGESLTMQEDDAADSAQDLSATSGMSMAAPENLVASSADEFAPPPAPHGYGGGTGDSDTGGGSATGGSADSPSMASAPAEERMADGESGPVIADEKAALRTDDELRAYYQGRPEAERLRGTAREEAVELAARHADQVRAAGPFSSGIRPDTCLDEVLQMDQGPRVVARAEWIQWQGGGSLAYVLAVAGPQSNAIDAFELWVMQPDGCGLRRHLSWR